MSSEEGKGASFEEIGSLPGSFWTNTGFLAARSGAAGVECRGVRGFFCRNRVSHRLILGKEASPCREVGGFLESRGLPV